MAARPPIIAPRSIPDSRIPGHLFRTLKWGASPKPILAARGAGKEQRMTEDETQKPVTAEIEAAATMADPIDYEPCDDIAFLSVPSGWEAHLRAA